MVSPFSSRQNIHIPQLQCWWEKWKGWKKKRANVCLSCEETAQRWQSGVGAWCVKAHRHHQHWCPARSCKAFGWLSTLNTDSRWPWIVEATLLSGLFWALVELVFGGGTGAKTFSWMDLRSYKWKCTMCVNCSNLKQRKTNWCGLMFHMHFFSLTVYFLDCDHVWKLLMQCVTMDRLMSAMLQSVCRGLNDTEPMVRNAALFALGQFSEHLQVRTTHLCVCQCILISYAAPQRKVTSHSYSHLSLLT